MNLGGVCLSARDKLWIVLLAGLVLAQIILSLLLGQGHALTTSSDLIQGALLLAATAAFLPNAFLASNSSRRTRMFWVLMSLGMLFWLVYQGMWNYFEVLRRQDVPDPFAGDVVLFLHLVPMMAALALLPHQERQERDPRIGTLDFSLLLTWWVFLYVYSVIPWQYVQVEESIYSNNFNQVYLTEKLVLLGLLVILLYNSEGGWRRLYAQLLGVLSLYASSSYVANWAIGHRSYYSGSIYDIPLTISVAWLALIGRFGRRYSLQQTNRSQPLLGVWITRLGMLAVFSLPLFGLYSLLDAGPLEKFRVTLCLITMILMGVMVFWRQSLLGEELSQLLASSQRSYEDLRKLQTQLIQSEKLASLGQLAGGAAHEINNPLTAMLGYSEILSASPLQEAEKRLAMCIGEQVHHTKALVASLLTFARQVPARLTTVDLHSVLRTAVRLLQPQLELKGGATRLELAPSLPAILADSNQLLHVCLHVAGLIANGFDPERSSVLHVQTRDENGVVVLEFSGASSGLRPDWSQPSTFDGAKPDTLSLSACRRILTEHGGRILSRRAPDGQIDFRLEFPATTGKPACSSETGLGIAATRS